MSKRHQSNRRKSYGRRQHEVSERRQRDLAPEGFEAGFDELGPTDLADLLDPRTPRLQFAMGD